MKITIIILTIAIALCNVSNVLADDNYRQDVHGEKPRLEKVINLQQRENAREKRNTESVEIPLMQDLSQCALSTNGQELLCIDTCGGRSAPYTICSNE